MSRSALFRLISLSSWLGKQSGPCTAVGLPLERASNCSRQIVRVEALVTEIWPPSWHWFDSAVLMSHKPTDCMRDV